MDMNCIRSSCVETYSTLWRANALWGEGGGGLGCDVWALILGDFWGLGLCFARRRIFWGLGDERDIGVWVWNFRELLFGLEGREKYWGVGLGGLGCWYGSWRCRLLLGRRGSFILGSLNGGVQMLQLGGHFFLYG